MSEINVPDTLLRQLVEADEAGNGAGAVAADTPRCLRLMEQARLDAERTRDHSTQSATTTAAVALPDNGSIPNTIGRFQIVHRIGHGAYGLVYLGLDVDLQRPTAVKVPRMLTLLDGKRRKRFLRESKAAAALNHPNIVTVYEAGFDGELAYIASAYCSAGTLEDFLAKGQTLSTEVAARVAATLADAIGHAHERGIIHRDLKPSNLFVQGPSNHDSYRDSDARDSDAKSLPRLIQVADFGLATIQSEFADATATEGIVGTPAYMAPEQARGDAAAVGPATDIYAIGVILYRMLTGRVPFVDDDQFALLRKVAEGNAVRPRLLRGEIHRDLEAVCLKCLAVNPAERYSSAAGLRDDLQNYLAGKPVSARPYRLTDSWVAWMKREPLVASLVALSVALLLTVIGGSVFAAGVFRKQRDDLRTQLTATEEARAETERLNVTLNRKLDEASADHMIRMFDEVIESGEATATHYQERGERAMNYGDYEKAYGDFQKYQKLAPGNPYVYTYMSWLLSCGSDEIRNPERALAMAEKARATGNSGHWSVRHVLGYALYVNGRFQEALDELSYSVENDPLGGQAIMWSYKAMSEHQLGLREDAKKSLAEAARIREERNQTSVFFELNFERAQRLLSGE